MKQKPVYHVVEPTITKELIEHLGQRHEAVVLNTEVNGRPFQVVAPTEAQARHELELYMLRLAL